MSSPFQSGSKRRRVDEFQSALHKPFRSPLRPVAGQTSTPIHNSPKTPAPKRDNGVHKQTPRNPLHKPFTPSHLAQSAGLLSSTPQDDEAETSHSQDTPMKQKASRPIPKSAIQVGLLPSSDHAALTSTSPSNELQTLERAVRALEMQSRALRTQISTLRQAAGLPPTSSPSYSSTASTSTPTSTSDPLPSTATPTPTSDLTHLTTLIKKWTLATQDAADVVHADVKLRFRDQGGLSAYRRQERKLQREREMEDWAWERATEFAASRGFTSSMGGEGAGQGLEQGEVEVEDKEEGSAYRLAEEGKRASLGIAGEGEDEDEDAEEEEEFTMEAMLAMLHIEPEVIGWDCKREMWVS